MEDNDFLMEHKFCSPSFGMDMIFWFKTLLVQKVVTDKFDSKTRW